MAKLNLVTEEKDFGLGELLEPLRQNYAIEFTLTHPHNKGWLNSLSKRQKMFYIDAFGLMCKFLLELGDIKEKEIYMEYHTNGQVHSHGFIIFETSKRFSREGLLSDLAKLYIKQMPKQYSNFKSNYVKLNPVRIFSPMINLNFLNEDVRPEWRKYIKKCQ